MRRLGPAASALTLVLPILLTIAFSPALGLIARKCCQQDEKLRLSNDSVRCVPTNNNNNQFLSHFAPPHSVVYGIPSQCPDPEVVDLAQKYFVTCMDNAEFVGNSSGNLLGHLAGNTKGTVLNNPGSTIVGLQCPQLPNFFFAAPRVDFLRKCCPKHRRYSSSAQTCWAGTKNLTVTAELIRVVFANFTSGFVDLSFGAPDCRRGDVLVDLLVPRSRVWFQDSGSVLVHPRGAAKPLLVVPEDMCVDLADDIDNMVVLRVCQDYRVVCQLEGKPCVRKCCKDGESLFGAHCLQSRSVARLEFHKVHASHPVPVPVPYAGPAFSYGLQCDKYPLDPSDDTDENYLLLNDSVFLPQTSQVIPPNGYCVEHVLSPSDGLNGTHAFVCFGGSYSSSGSGFVQSPLYGVVFVLMLMSCVCLLLTFLVYMCVPFLHGSLHGKTLMSHVAALLSAYICLTVLQNERSLTDDTCKNLGYFLHYSFLSAFLWLNVISFDIWWTFGTIRSFVSKKAVECRRFIYYSIYGWGFSALLTSVTILVDNHHSWVPPMMRPDMGSISCFLSPKTYGLLIFFCTPVSIAFTINIVLFILTANYCYKTRTRLEKMAVTDPAKKRYQNDKSKLILMGKLIVMMGLTWALEMVSRLELLPKQVWYMSDLVNALQGFLIFTTFALKPRVLSSLANRLRSHQPSTSTMFTTAASDSRMCPSARTSSRTSQ